MADVTDWIARTEEVQAMLPVECGFIFLDGQGRFWENKGDGWRLIEMRPLGA